jgi:hypothetical protein
MAVLSGIVLFNIMICSENIFEKRYRNGVKAIAAISHPVDFFKSNAP